MGALTGVDVLTGGGTAHRGDCTRRLLGIGWGFGYGMRENVSHPAMLNLHPQKAAAGAKHSNYGALLQVRHFRPAGARRRIERRSQVQDLATRERQLLRSVTVVTAGFQGLSR